MNLFKPTNILAFVILAIGSSMVLAATPIPSSQTIDMNKDAAEVDGMPMEIRFNHNKCAGAQVSEIRESLKLYTFRKTLERVGVNRIVIRVEKSESRKDPKASFSKDNSTLFVKSYPFIDTQNYSSFSQEQDGGCRTFLSKDLNSYAEKVTAYLNVKDQEKDQQKVKDASTGPIKAVESSGLK